MNCKPGDLAVVVRCIYKKNIGALFKVVSNYRCDAGEWYGEALTAMQTNRGPRPAGSMIYMNDYDLRPICPNDSEDEMIRIAGKPHDAHKSTTEAA